MSHQSGVSCNDGHYRSHNPELPDPTVSLTAGHSVHASVPMGTKPVTNTSFISRTTGWILRALVHTTESKLTVNKNPADDLSLTAKDERCDYERDMAPKLEILHSSCSCSKTLLFCHSG